MRRRLLAAVAVAAVVLGVATERLFVHPSVDEVRPVDAVVLFAGGRGERLAAAERLMDDGVAPVLVVPNGHAPEWPAGNAACTEERPYEVRCPSPSPDTTRGEARAIATLAAAEGWDTVLVVTSTYHVSRAGLALARCVDGAVLTAASPPAGLGAAGWIRRIAHEWLAWTRSVVFDRSC